MTIRWLRRVQVRTANLIIEEPEIFGVANYSANASQNSCDLTIMNLNPGHIGAIQEAADQNGPLEVVAGYRDSHGVVFNGSLQRVRQGLRPGDGQRTRIRGGDPIYTPGAPRPGGITGVSARSYERTPARQVAIDLANDAGMPIRNTALIPEGSSVEGLTVAGESASALSRLLAPLGLTWYIFDGNIVINRAGQAIEGPRRLIISQRTGMIGAPTVTDDGAEVEMFLNPSVGIGDELRLESRFLGDDWKVVALRHTFANRGGESRTWCDLRELEPSP